MTREESNDRAARRALQEIASLWRDGYTAMLIDIARLLPSPRAAVGTDEPDVKLDDDELTTGLRRGATADGLAVLGRLRRAAPTSEPPAVPAPVVTIDSGPDPRTVSTDAEFTFSSDDPTATLTCELDGVVQATCESPAEFTGLSRTAHTFVVTATDPADNVRHPAASSGSLVIAGAATVSDPAGVRPLAVGELESGHHVIASESCAFDIIGAKLVREVEPGEMVALTKDGLGARQVIPSERRAGCIFEHIYFSRPDSMIYGEMVDKVRRKIGKQLAHEAPVPKGLDDDRQPIVISVPDSSNTSALGYVNAGLELLQQANDQGLRIDCVITGTGSTPRGPTASDSR